MKLSYSGILRPIIGNDFTPDKNIASIKLIPSISAYLSRTLVFRSNNSSYLPSLTSTKDITSISFPIILVPNCKITFSKDLSGGNSFATSRYL